MKKSTYLLAVMMLITSCQTISKNVKDYDLVFNNENPLIFDAKEFKIKILYEPSFKAPNIEHLMPYPLERAILAWVDANFKVSGEGNNIITFLIKDASVTEEVLDENLLKGGRREVYQAKVTIALEFVDDAGKKTETLAKSWQQYTSPMIMSLERREDAWFDIVKDVTEDAGHKLETTIRQFLSDYIL